MKDQAHDFSGLKADSWQEARADGIDTGRIEFLLTLSPAERLRRHDVVGLLIIAAQQAGMQYYGFNPRLTGRAE